MHNSGGVQRYNSINICSLSKDKFLKDFLERCYENNLLDNQCLQRINYERMNLLKKQLTYYTKNESSSVMVEKAENIMKSIDFTIGFYLKSFHDVAVIIEKLKNNSLEDIFCKGQAFIDIEVIKCKNLFQKVMDSKLNVMNYSYDDTIDDCGIGIFFKKYDSRFAADVAPCSVDYQSAIDFMDYVGIEYIKKYLTAIYLENTFCNNFSIDLIKNLLRSYYDQYESLLINIFEIVLTNAIGLYLAGKDIRRLDISQVDREVIIGRIKDLSEKEIIKEIILSGDKCCDILEINDEYIREYVKNTSKKIGEVICSNIKTNDLDAIFISFKEEKKIIKYYAGIQVSNEVFKSVTEEIISCTLVEDKIRLIRENFKSIEDLIDMLDAQCLFDEEYLCYFKTLSEVELVLLIKSVYEDSDKEWYMALRELFLSFDKEKLERLDKIKDNIELC